MSSSQLPKSNVYSSADPKVRGLIVGLSQQMIGVGFIVSTWVGYGSDPNPAALPGSQVSWRVPLAVQCVPCIILTCGIMFFPESPRHLMETDREEEAMKVLKKLHLKKDRSNESEVEAEFHEIKVTIAAEKAITVPSWSIMFTVPQWRTRLMHGVAVQVFTQFTGISRSYLLLIFNGPSRPCKNSILASIFLRQLSICRECPNQFGTTSSA